VTDEYYADQVLGHLPEDQRALVMNMLKHGEERHRMLTDSAYRQQVVQTLPPDQQKAAAEIMQLVEKEPQILTNAELREQIVNSMEPSQRQVAENTFNLGALAAEDSVQAYLLGMGVSKEEMMQSLKELTPQQNEEFVNAYARKYGESVDEVLTDKLSGKDEAIALREIRRAPETAQEAFQDVRETVADATSGDGASLTSWWASAAGDMAENKVLQLQAKLAAPAAASAADQGTEFPVDQAMKMANTAYEYTELFEAAKERTADALSDIVLGVATIAVPGGIWLKALMIVGGGFLKSGVKRAIIGERYEMNAADFVGGMVDTAFSMVDPMKLGAAAGLGRKAATLAVEHAVEKVGGDLLIDGREAHVNKD